MPDRVVPHHGLTQILIDAGVVTAEQVQAGLARQRETGLRIGETLVEIGAATEEDIGWALAQQLGMPLVDLRDDMLDPELLGRFPVGVLYRLQAVPLLRTDEGLSFALCDPLDAPLVAHLAALAGCPVIPSVATPSAIRRVLAPRLGAHTAPASPHANATSLGGYVVWDRSGASFLQYLLHTALRTGARAIHCVPQPGGVRIYQRGPGGVAPLADESSEAFEALLTQLELLGAPVGALASERHRTARVDFAMGAETLRLEVVLLVLDGATTVTLRLPAAADAPATLDSLGLDAVDAACVRDVLHRPAGLVLVSGPPGSGRTTTLSCLLAEALREDRCAMVFGGVPAPRPAKGLLIALPTPESDDAWEALVTAHAPDVAVLDDLAPGERVRELASPAGMERLLIAGTDWGDTFALLAHAAADVRLGSAFANRLTLVLQQRLLPASDGAGVRACFEVLLVSDALREAIRDHAPANALRRIAEAEGFRGLAARLHEESRAGRLDATSITRALAA